MSAEGGILNIVGMNDLNFLLNGNPSQQKNEDDIIENKIFTKLFKRRTYSKYRNFGLQKFRIDYDGQRDLNLTSSSTFVFKISEVISAGIFRYYKYWGADGEAVRNFYLCSFSVFSRS